MLNVLHFFGGSSLIFKRTKSNENLHTVRHNKMRNKNKNWIAFEKKLLIVNQFHFGRNEIRLIHLNSYTFFIMIYFNNLKARNSEYYWKMDIKTSMMQKNIKKLMLKKCFCLLSYLLQVTNFRWINWDIIFTKNLIND